MTTSGTSNTLMTCLRLGPSMASWFKWRVCKCNCNQHEEREQHDEELHFAGLIQISGRSRTMSWHLWWAIQHPSCFYTNSQFISSICSFWEFIPHQKDSWITNFEYLISVDAFLSNHYRMDEPVEPGPKISLNSIIYLHILMRGSQCSGALRQGIIYNNNNSKRIIYYFAGIVYYWDV